MAAESSCQEHRGRLVVLSIARRFFAEGQARGEMVRQLRGVTGPKPGLAVAALLEKTAEPRVEAVPIGVADLVLLRVRSTSRPSSSSGPS